MRGPVGRRSDNREVESLLRLILQFGRFGIVGALATAVHFCTVVALVEWFATAPLPANGLGYGLAFAVSWFGSSRWTFRGAAAVRFAVPRFLCVSLLGLALNQAVNALAIYGLGAHYLTGLAAALLLVPVVTFTLNRIFVFPQTPAQSGPNN